MAPTCADADPGRHTIADDHTRSVTDGNARSVANGNAWRKHPNADTACERDAGRRHLRGELRWSDRAGSARRLGGDKSGPW